MVVKESRCPGRPSSPGTISIGPGSFIALVCDNYRPDNSKVINLGLEVFGLADDD